MLMGRSRTSSASAFRSLREATLQLGFCGLLTMMSRVRSLNVLRTRSQSKRNVGGASGTRRQRPPANRIAGGIENDDLVAGAYHCLDCVVQGFGAAARNGDLGQRIDLKCIARPQF